MRHVSSRHCLVLAIFLFLTGCNTAPIYNVKDVNLGSESRSIEEVGDAIIQAGQNRRWVMQSEGIGKIRGILYVRSHKAEVLITYDTNSFSIEYADSSNLKYDEESKVIHKRYNGWVRRLEAAIHKELSKRPATISWRGAHVDELIASWGKPSRVTTLSKGGKVLEYIYRENFGFIAGATLGARGAQFGRSGESTCKAIFATDNTGLIISEQVGGGDLACKELRKQTSGRRRRP